MDIFLSFTWRSLIIGILATITQGVLPFAPTPAPAPTSRSVPSDSVVFAEPAELPDLLTFRNHYNALIVDVRAYEHYQHGHVAGAVNWDAAAADDRPPGRITALLEDENRPVFLYANASDKKLVNKAAMALSLAGSNPLYWYSPGWEQWKACGLPTGAGDE